MRESQLSVHIMENQALLYTNIAILPAKQLKTYTASLQVCKPMEEDILTGTINMY